MSRLWIIISRKGEIIKEKGRVRFFITPEEADRYIDHHLGNSPYLDIKEWRNYPKVTKEESQLYTE